MKAITKAADIFSFSNRYFYVHISIFQGWIGNKIALHPKLVLGSVFLLGILGSFGFFALESETSFRNLYIPSNSKTEEAMKETEGLFMNALNSRRQSVLLTVKKRHRVFQQKCVKEGKSIVDQLVSEQEFQNLCYRRQEFPKNDSYYDQNQHCVLLNPFELIKNMSNAETEISQAMQNKNYIMSNGKLAVENMDAMFSRKASGAGSLNYKSVQIILFLKEFDKTTDKRTRVQAWEKKFVAKMKEIANSAACYDITYVSGSAIDEEITRLTSRDKWLSFLCFAVFIVENCVFMTFYHGINRSSLVAICFGTLNLAITLFSSFGVATLLTIKFTSMYYGLVLLCTFSGFQVMFWIMEEFKKQEKVKLLRVRVANTLRNIGPVLSMTTLMNTLGFALCAISRYPIVRNFCLIGFISFLSCFLLSVAVLISLLSLQVNKGFQRRTKKGERAEERRLAGQGKTQLRRFMKSVSKGIAERIVSKGGRVIGVLVCLAVLAVGIYGCMKLEFTLHEKDMVRKGKRTFRYLDKRDSDFNAPIGVSVIDKSNMNYSDVKILETILDRHKEIVRSSKYTSISEPWIPIFIRWVNHTNRTKLRSGNGSGLIEFFSTTNNSRYQRDAVIRGGRIVASKTEIYMSNRLNQHFRAIAMVELRKLLGGYQSQPHAIADEFLLLEHASVIREEVIKVLILLTLVVLISPIILCIYISLSLMAVFVFALFITELLGFMGLLGISLNSLTILCVISSVPLVAINTVHITNKFALSNKKGVQCKLIEALADFLPSMVITLSSVLLAFILSLAMENRPLLIYFGLVCASAILGILVNLVLLPNLLLLCGFLWRSDSNHMATKMVNDKDLVLKGSKGSQRQSVIRSLDELDPSISVVGISARFPTARNKDEFWQLLIEGRNTLSDYPLQRKSPRSDFKKYYNPSRGVKGRLYVTAGSYLEGIDLFDNNFFGISQAEAEMMDPQQRILIQGVFEAIEDGGLTLEEIQSVNTGVYVGNMNQDYSSNMNASNKFDRNQFTGTGTSSAIMANRISFALNLKGPSVTMDTACSCSSTALSFAYEHLKSGKCDIAIVGASNVIVDKDKHMIICQAKMLAPDGQSKAFDARGDGYGRGEGMVVVVLKLNPKSNTRNQNAYCNILACNVNNDGQSAIPITAPSVEGQSRLFQVTCMEAGIKPESVSYLEAHGTGTVVGDRVETQSISLAYCSNRHAEDLLRVGSVKSNINHTESVAGLAGLAKVCLMMEHKTFVPTVGIEELNPDLDLDRRGLHVQQTCEVWPDDPKGRLRTAAVNSFGFGGSNAHIVVQECPRSNSGLLLQYDNNSFEKENSDFYVLVLSARTRNALLDQAKLLSNWIINQAPTPTLALDLCYSLSERRTRHNFRMALAFNNLKDSVNDLDLFTSDNTSASTNASISSDRVRHTSPLIGFVFGGQGSDVSGLVEMLSEHHSLRGHFDMVEIAIKQSTVTSTLLKEIRRLQREFKANVDHVSQSGLSELTKHQLTIFKVQYAIAKLLMQNCGIRPTGVLGHSLGNVTAACISECISLSNAVDLIIVRAELQNLCRKDGHMAAVGMSKNEMLGILRQLKLEDKVNIAAINDDQSITISGDADGLTTIEAFLTNQGESVFWRKLKTAKAYHSHHMASIEELFLKHAKKIKFKSQWSSVQFISSVHSKLMTASDLSGLYWWQNVRYSVDFNGASKELFNLNCAVVVEISATPVLQHYLKNISKSYALESQGHVIDVISAMPRSKVADKVKHVLAQCIGQLFNIGYQVNFATLMDFSAAKFVRYPSYAWQETSFWYKEPEVDDQVKMHPLGEVEVTNMDRSKSYRSEIDVFKMPFLADHKLKDIGTAFPRAGYVEIALKAALGARELKSLVMENVTFDNILTLSDNVVKMVHTVVEEDDAGKLGVKVMEIIDESEMLLSSASVRILDDKKKGKALGDLMDPQNQKGSPRISYEITQMQKNAEKVTTAHEMHKVNEEIGVHCGEAFSLLGQGWFKKGKFLAKFKLSPAVLEDLGLFVLHPAIIDAALQCLQVALDQKMVGSIIPVGIGCLTFFPVEKHFSSFYCMVSNYATNREQAKLKLMTEKGEIIMTVKEMKVVDLTKVRPKLSLQNSMYEMDVVPGVLNSASLSQMKDCCRWIIVGLMGSKIQQSFCNCLQNYGFKRADIILMDLEMNASVVDIASEIKSLSSMEKLNILVNFVPHSLKLCSNLFHYGSEADQILFKNCLHELCILLADENLELKVEFVTCEDVYSRRITHDSERSEPNHPFGSLVWGFSKALRLEWPSKSIQCSDISKAASTSELEMIAAHCINDLAEPEVVIRGENCNFPRLNPLDIEESKSVKQCSSIELVNIPHYFVLNGSEGTAATFKDNSPHAVDDDSFCLSTRFIGGLLGGISHLQIQDRDSVPSSVQPISCYGGVKDEVSDPDELKGKEQFITFQSGYRLYSKTRVKTCEVAQVPSWLDMKESVASAGPLIVASRILKMVRRCLLKCQRCLIISEKENLEIAFITMLTSSAAGIDVYTDCLHFDERMSAAGIQFVSTHDIEDECGDLFDCVIAFDNSLSQEMESIESAVSQKGCIIFVETACNESKTKNIVFASSSRKIPCYRFDCSKISPKGLAAEWLSLLPSDKEESCLFRELKRVCINKIDPYCNELSFNETEEVRFDLLHVNTTVCESVVINKSSMDSIGFKVNRTYLVIGGHKGLGMETSLWLMRNGADHVITCGRSPLPKDLSAVYAMQGSKNKVRFEHVACDVTTTNGILKLQARLGELPPLAGIINSAVVYDDRVSKDVDYASFGKVIGPKVLGTIKLYEMVKKMNVYLDFFILYSSIASNVGNVGQASYCAGNFFMNEFANHMNLLHGQNFLSICWGPMGDAGYLSEHEDVAKIITEKLGLHIIPIKTGLEWLKTILIERPITPTITFNSFDFLKMNNKTNPLKTTATVRHLIPQTSDESIDSDKGPLGTLKELTTPDARWAYLSDYLKAWFAKWLGTADISEVDLNSSLSQYGIDSGGAMGFQSTIETDFEVTIPVYELLRPDSTGLVLVGKIMSQLNFDNPESEDAPSNTDEGKQDPEPVNEEVIVEEDAEENTERNQDQEDEALTHLDNFCAIAHAPSKAQANFFWIHSTHRYRGHMLSVAKGFKSQEMFKIYSIGSEDMFYKARITESVPLLAKAYIRLIFRIQPRGPFFVGGFSFGGLIALEIASILKKKGDLVALLVMVDTFPWISDTFALEKYYMKFAKLQDFFDSKYFLESFMKSTALYKLGMNEETFKEMFSKSSIDAVADYLNDVAKSKEINLPDLKLLCEAVQHNITTTLAELDDWHPSETLYDGPLLFIEARNKRFTPHPPGWERNSLSWRDLIQPQEFYSCVVDSDHHSIIQQRNGIEIGKMVSTMSRFILKKNFPTVSRSEMIPIDNYSIQAISEGFSALLGHGEKEIHGIFKANLNKRKLKFKSFITSKLEKQYKISLRFDEITNVTKADPNFNGSRLLTTMGVVIWARSKQHELFFQSWVEYNRIILGLQGILGVRLQLLQ